MSTRLRREHTDNLRRLAERYGIAPQYRAMDGKQTSSPDDALLAALRAFGVELESLDDARSAYNSRLTQDWTSLCDQSAVCWDGAGEFEVRLPSRHTTTELRMTMVLEDGSQMTDTVSVRDYKVVGAARPDRLTSYLARSIALPWELPAGYHRLDLESGELSGSMLVISAPKQAFQHHPDRSWGTFLPLYSLNATESWGAGSYSDLRRLVEWTAERGGRFVGTLPLLPAFLDEPFRPEPYSPVSRLFWNEFFIDLSAVPELANSSDARAIISSADFQRELVELRGEELVDYRRGMRLRRSVLETLVETLLAETSDRQNSFARWLVERPDVRNYACFRAICERHGAAPGGWPSALRADEITSGDYDEAAFNYHAYVQWLAEEQLSDIPRRPESGCGLYLDLPIGVSGDGYDVWSEPELFATGFSVGAPPDRLGPAGQNWGFPPLDPLALRRQGYRHFIDVVRHHMRHASMLRVDHMMGLHRQFWIPTGAESKDGVYVHYPADDLYAILTLESHRNQTELVGEDLGTVPEYVRPRMTEHGISRMLIVPFEVSTDSTTLNDIPELALTALNTHDLPPFAGVCEQWFDDERQQVLVTLLKEEGRLADDDEDDLEAIIAATLEHLGASNARAVLVNLEDLWLETRSQNIPGTIDEHPNWRRKASQRFEEFSGSQTVLKTLARLDDARRQQNGEDHQV